MGLDMNAWRTAPINMKDPAARVDVELVDGAPSSEVAYWRKFNALHGWMKRLYRDRGGTDDQFNCANLRLDAEDLDALEAALRAGSLRPVDGFFFGPQTVDPQDVQQTLERDLPAMRAALAEGDVLLYSAWW